MDMSKEYIKMCEKAVELQGKWKANIGDIYFHAEIELFSGFAPWEEGTDIVVENGDGGVYGFEPDDINDARCPKNKYRIIWLPRQDQLQEMINRSPQYLLLDFYNEVGALFDGLKQEWLRFTSWEQLWLAFVMKEKYKKIWDGKEWLNKGGKEE